MNTDQLEKIISNDKIANAKFCGVFAENNLPKHLETFPCGFIANTDPEFKPGQHWVAFYFSSMEHGEFFDSYGQPPQFYSNRYLQFLIKNSRRWICNDKKLQGAFTSVCGEYCIFYLLHRARGMKMSTINNLFSSDKEHNDHLVYEFVMQLLR